MNVENECFWLNIAYEQLFPERTLWRHPWMRAEDLMNHDQFIVSKLGELLALRVLCSILFDVVFPDDKCGKRCKVRAQQKMNTILATSGRELWWEEDFRMVETLLYQMKSVEEIRTALNS